MKIADPITLNYYYYHNYCFHHLHHLNSRTKKRYNELDTKIDDGMINKYAKTDSAPHPCYPEASSLRPAAGRAPPCCLVARPRESCSPSITKNICEHR